ncbi:unnamed protein product [Arabidopsis halleri]
MVIDLRMAKLCGETNMKENLKWWALVMVFVFNPFWMPRYSLEAMKAQKKKTPLPGLEPGSHG